MGVRTQALPPVEERRRRRALFLWLWLSPERRFYTAALGMGLLLLVWASLTAIGARERFPALDWRLPSLDDISLPGRPVMIPVVGYGKTTTAWGIGTPGDWLEVWKETEAMGRTYIPADMTDQRLMLRVTGNLPRLLVPPPPMRGFQPLRLIDVDMVDADTQLPVNWRGREVEVRVAIRPVDLERVRGDSTRLMLLHWDTTLEQWEDTHAVARDGFLVTAIRSLSPFAVGYIDEGGFLSGVLGLRAPAPTATPTSEPETPSDPPLEAVPARTTLATPNSFGPSTLDVPTPGAEQGPPTGETSDLVPTPTTPTAPLLPVGTPALGPAFFGTPVTPPLVATKIAIVEVVASTPTATPTPGSSPSPTPPPTAASSGSIAEPAPTSSTIAPTPSAPVPVVNFTSAGGSAVPRLFNETMKPGDLAIANVVVVNNSGTGITYGLTTTPTSSSPLDLDVLQGLQLTVLRCGGSTFTSCPVTAYDGPLVTTNAPMGGPNTVGSGAGTAGIATANYDYLQLRVTFPSSAGNVFKATQSVVSFTWTASEAF